MNDCCCNDSLKVRVTPRRKRLLVPVLSMCACLLGPMSAAWSQIQDLSVEELEALIEQRRIELDKAEENRQRTREQARSIDAALDEQQQRQQALEAELRALCDEREQARPGSLEACLAEHSL